jgi:hypothetical protein
MRKKLIVLLAMSLCGFWGCASSKSNDTATFRSETAGDQNQEEAPSPDSAIADVFDQTPTVAQNREHTPAQSVAIADKLAQIPAVDQNRKHTPARSSALADKFAQTTAVDQNREQTPVPGSAIADKLAQTPASTPKVKPNDAAALPAAAANNGNSESKPAEMKVANAFDHEPYLSSKLKSLLPPRTTVMGAATGFKNQKQFIAAMHLSRNLDIPFVQIKARMTGEHRMSLPDSLRDLRPEMTKNEVKAEVNKAEKQAKEDENEAKDEAKKAAAQDKLATNGKS